MYVSKVYSGVQIRWQRIFWAGNQGIHQNFEKSLLTYKCWLIFMRMKQKKIFFLKKTIPKWPTQKKLSFSNPPILNIFPTKFQRLVLRYIKYIDAKSNDVVQPIWLSDCPM